MKLGRSQVIGPSGPRRVERGFVLCDSGYRVRSLGTHISFSASTDDDSKCEGIHT